MHLDDERLEALLSGELPEREARSFREHLASCSQCAAAFEAAEQEDREIGRLLVSLDHAVPAADPQQLARRVRAPVPRPRLVAATVALLVVAGAATAMPGSPVRGWLSRLIGGVDEEQTIPRGAQAADSSGLPPAGVSVLPTERFELVFEAIQDVGLIRISLADQAEIAVRSDREGVGFSVEPRGVRVLNAGSAASYEVIVPDDAQDVLIRVLDTIVFERQAGTVIVPAAGVAADGFVVDFGALVR